MNGKQNVHSPSSSIAVDFFAKNVLDIYNRSVFAKLERDFEWKNLIENIDNQI